MAKSQSDRYERDYFHKIWMEYYCLGKNHACGTLSLKFIRCQNLRQLQNLNLFSLFQGHKNPHGQNFWNLDFLSEKTRLHYISHKQKSTYGHIIFINQ